MINTPQIKVPTCKILNVFERRDWTKIAAEGVLCWKSNCLTSVSIIHILLYEAYIATTIGERPAFVKCYNRKVICLDVS